MLKLIICNYLKYMEVFKWLEKNAPNAGMQLFLKHLQAEFAANAVLK